jgi:hypothetical protein
MRLHVGDMVPDAQFLDAQGVHVSMAELYQSHGLVISFLRHFG